MPDTTPLAQSASTQRSWKQAAVDSTAYVYDKAKEVIHDHPLMVGTAAGAIAMAAALATRGKLFGAVEKLFPRAGSLLGGETKAESDTVTQMLGAGYKGLKNDPVFNTDAVNSDLLKRDSIVVSSESNPTFGWGSTPGPEPIYPVKAPMGPEIEQTRAYALKLFAADRNAADSYRWILPDPEKGLVEMKGLTSLLQNNETERLLAKYPGAFVHPGASVGENATIGKGSVISRDAFVDSFVHVGENVRVHAGATVDAGSRIGDGSVIGEGAYLSMGTAIGKNVKIAADASIKGISAIGDESTIGRKSIVDMSTVESKVAVGDDTVLRSVSVRDSVSIGSHSSVENAILDNSAEVGNNVRIKSGSIGDGAKIGDGSNILFRPIPAGATIAPGQELHWWTDAVEK